MAQSSSAIKSQMNGQQDTKKSLRAKTPSSKANSTTAKISAELSKLCKCLNDSTASTKELYKLASDVVIKHHKAAVGPLDSVYITETLRRFYEEQRGQGDRPNFDELLRTYKQNARLKNADAPLQFLVHLANSSPSVSDDTKRPFLVPALANAGVVITPKSTQQSSVRSDGTPPPVVSTSSQSGTVTHHVENAVAPKQSVHAKKVSDKKQNVMTYQATSTIITRPKLTIYDRKVDVPEWALIQDLIYSFQGINGKYLKYDPITQGYIIDPKVHVKPYFARMCLRLSELSWLHQKVRSTCDSWVQTKSTGLVHQSLIAVLRKELTEFYRVLAVVRTESDMSSPDSSDSLGNVVSLPSCEDIKGLTLCRLSVWTKIPQQRLTWLAVICDVTQGLRGGAIASCVYSYLQHGDPAVRDIIKRILSAVCKPIFTMLGRWILDGELDDPYGEFFIAGNSDIKGERLWHEKYRVQETMVPSFITMEQARKILITGKSINFLREVCDDHTEIHGREVLRQALESTSVEALFMSDREGELAAMMDSAYLETSKRVIETLTNQYKFLEHLQALRRYMLLGQGDFIRHLMELLETELQKPANELFPHNLSGILETAIRATNAQYEDKDILNRLDIRILEQSPGDTGWDVFVLDYHTDGPIGTVFGPSSTEYLLLFQSLWKMKRVEWVLSRLWTKQITASKELRKIPELEPVLAQIHLLTSEMVHFVHQMQYYVLFEVIACAWEELLSKIAHAESLDDIVAAHQSFLKTVKAGALLETDTLDLSIHLRAMFETILRLESQVDLVHNRANKEMKRRDRRAMLIEARCKQGLFGITAEAERQFEESTKSFLEGFVPNIRVQLKTLTISYQSCARKLLLLLSSSQDISLQLLSFRLDFNEHYKRNDPRLSASVTYQHRRLSEMGLGLVSNQ